MNKKIEKGLSYLFDLGIPSNLSPLNIIRFRVINITNYLIFTGAGLLLFYRIYILDFISIGVNGSLVGLMILNIYFCKKSRHHIAISLTSLYLLVLAVHLSQYELFLSGVIYLSILPLVFTLLHSNTTIKHLYYLVCVSIFTYFSFHYALDGTVLFTYVIVTFGFYIAFLNFFDLMEQKQQELEQVIAKLETQNSELDQFSYITSHDLQEPLGIISNFSKILSSKHTQSLDEEGKKSIAFIQDASNRMSAQIKGLLDYSLIGNNGVHEPIIVGELIKRIRKTLHSSLSSTKAKVVVDDIPIIIGYKAEMEMLFQHLIVNAIKFRRPETPPIIRISVIEKNNLWQFAVKDNGIGIEKAYSNKIFGMFQRLLPREKYAGNGIGLSHCKKIVHLHGGNIWVESKLSQGSTFHFTIKKKGVKSAGKLAINYQVGRQKF